MYFITFIDDCSRYTYVYLLKSKDQAFETFKIYKAEVENQIGKKIQILRSDRGGEYFSTKFSFYCESQGLIHQRTTPYTPQQNGVAERKNRVLQDMINAMLVSANLPKNLWAHMSYLDSNVIVESRDVNFFDNKFRHDSTSIFEIVTQIPQDISSPDLNSSNNRNMAAASSAPKRSKSARKERNLDPDFIDSQAIIFLVKGDNDNNVVNKVPVLLNVEDVPKIYKEGIISRNYAFWKEAIDDEMESLVSNNTWELSDLPPGTKAIGCRWVFRIKYHTDGSIQTFKPRLVIQGFSQRQRVDYFDTYALVARITSIRVLFALALIYNLPIHQMDVKTTFLNGDLDEEVYMKPPEGFVFPGHENKVCKLKKSLYGLKQEPKQWHNKFDKSVLSNGFTHNSSDRCIYSKFIKDYGVILCLYVDDILIVGTNMEDEANTSYESSCKLLENNGRVVAQIEYASAIVCLMYATHCTRPDIAYAICKLSRYTSNPSQGHWKTIGRVYGYLKRTRQLALYYDCFLVILEGYSNASWITSSIDSKSTTGWIFTLGGGVVC
ncbi:zinc finger, CCHC-type containing protein [Tanacetum coccineum]